MSIINNDLLKRVSVSVTLRNPSQIKAKIVVPGSQNNFRRVTLYGGLFIKYEGKYIPIFYLNDDISIVIPSTSRDITIAGGLDNIAMYPMNLINIALHDVDNISIKINSVNYYELYKIKQFLDMITPMKPSIREHYLVEIYHYFKEIQNIVTYEKVGDSVIFYLTDGSAILQINGKHVKLLSDFVATFKSLSYSEKETNLNMIKTALLFSNGKRAIIDERDGHPLISVDDVKWSDLYQESDYIIALFNDSSILANIEDTVILHSKRNSEFDYILQNSKFLYTLKLKNVKKVYKFKSSQLGRVKPMYLVYIDGSLKYSILQEVANKIEDYEVDLIRTQIYNFKEKMNNVKTVATVKMLNLLGLLLEDDE